MNPNPGVIIVNRLRRNSTTDFVDMQVSTLISAHASEEPCIEDLVDIAKEEMPKFEWTDPKIRNSVNRLEKRGRLMSKYVIRRKRLCRVPYPI
jgi:hypothetical protein